MAAWRKPPFTAKDTRVFPLNDTGESPPRTLILGLGNTLLTDEALGAVVIRLLEAEGGLGDVGLLDGGTLSFTLSGPIADSPRLIVVDAAVMGEQPGTVRVFEGEAMDRQLSGIGKSVHEVSLMDLMDMARITDSLPSHRALVGVEPAVVDWGDELSPVVAAAVPEAIARIRNLLQAWDGGAELIPGEDRRHG
ncbi:MAG: HyaD/HybD family hydrogenase maturation endopeptidase [Chromatiaceae bacterium]|nr:HyaD/HybD family hydrogenase maturation endopeptidase [Chromatiaceae bacterium]MBP7983749.1 HyaD/HybD family hydrogenase maturation endopeptidase [Chromatiaceae bacterium]